MENPKLLHQVLRSLGLVAVGIFMFCTGLIILKPAFKIVFPYYKSSGWRECEAEILQSELNELSTSKQGKSFYVTAKYKYVWQGKPFTGENVIFRNKEIDNKVGVTGFPRPFWEKLFLELSEKKQKKLKQRIWVDPHEPSQSVAFRIISRNAYILLLFCLALCANGIMAISIGGKYLWKNYQKLVILELQSSPWEFEDIWSNFNVISEAEGGWFTDWIFVFSVSPFATAVALIIVCIEGTSISEFLTFIGLFVAGLGGVGYFIFHIFRNVYSGFPVLMLSQMPLVPGIAFSGLVRVKERCVPSEGFKVLLNCHEKTARNQDGPFSFEKELTPVFPKQGTGERGFVFIPIKFEIPEDSVVRKTESNNSVYWYLDIWGNGKIPFFHARFDMPVFKVQNPRLIVANPQFPRV